MKTWKVSVTITAEIEAETEDEARVEFWKHVDLGDYQDDLMLDTVAEVKT